MTQYKRHLYRHPDGTWRNTKPAHWHNGFTLVRMEDPPKKRRIRRFINWLLRRKHGRDLH